MHTDCRFIRAETGDDMLTFEVHDTTRERLRAACDAFNEALMMLKSFDDAFNDL